MYTQDCTRRPQKPCSQPPTLLQKKCFSSFLLLWGAFANVTCLWRQVTFAKPHEYQYILQYILLLLPVIEGGIVRVPGRKRFFDSRKGQDWRLLTSSSIPVKKSNRPAPGFDHKIEIEIEIKKSAKISNRRRTRTERSTSYHDGQRRNVIFGMWGWGDKKDRGFRWNRPK
jgi:hypothetical protein